MSVRKFIYFYRLILLRKLTSDQRELRIFFSHVKIKFTKDSKFGVFNSKVKRMHFLSENEMNCSSHICFRQNYCSQREGMM